MKQFKEYTEDAKVCEEYTRAFLLNIFAQICDSMKKDIGYRNQIMRMYRESINFSYTFKLFVEKEFEVKLSESEVDLLCKWLKANFAKKPSRMDIPFTVKEHLFILQEGKCTICKKKLGNDWSKIHVDHIVPWDFVGDELEDNYQDLCETCNFEKGTSITYTFLKYLGLCKRR